MDVDTSGLCSNGIYFSLAFLMLFFPTPASITSAIHHGWFYSLQFLMWVCGQNISVLTWMQAAYNVIAYKDKPRLRTAVELLRTTQEIECRLKEVCCFSDNLYIYIYNLLNTYTILLKLIRSTLFHIFFFFFETYLLRSIVRCFLVFLLSPTIGSTESGNLFIYFWIKTRLML